MEQDVDQGYRTVCTTCLSSDRDLFDLSSMPQIQEIFNMLMFDFTRDRLDLPEITYLICWECLAMMKRVHRFKWQVHNAQEHLRLLALSLTQEGDHTYLSQSLSTLAIETKTDYDKIFFDYSMSLEALPRIISINSTSNIKNEHFELHPVESVLDIDDQMMGLSEIVLENETRMSHIIVDNSYIKSEGRVPCLTIQPMTPKFEKEENKANYVTEHMSEAEMIMTREQAKKKVQYASSVYKCELCIIGFYTQQQVEDHFENAHRAKPGLVSCKICYLYTEEANLSYHQRQHYLRHICKLCSHIEHSARLMELHVSTHMGKPTPSALIKIEGQEPKKKQRQHYLRHTCKLCSHVEYSARLMELHVSTHMGKPTPSALIKIEGQEPKKKLKKNKKKLEDAPPPKPGDLRKLLSKTTIEGYKCLECDMFFKNSRARKNHVARFHREGLQCDHCKKRFVNKGTLTTHLRLHEGPLPKEECPICHKMVRTIQIKYHIQRHQNKSRYECNDCNKIFSHLATYHAHLKYSRAHASDSVFKFPCPMCNKGYPTKEAMQDHFNYQHLGKTAHKCPICEKPIASKSNVEKHIARVHGEKKEKPRNHICDICGKSFTDKKALTQHEAIHSGLRPLSCDICQQTFKQKASLYTHRKRVHKLTPLKKQVHYMDKE